MVDVLIFTEILTCITYYQGLANTMCHRAQFPAFFSLLHVFFFTGPSLQWGQPSMGLSISLLFMPSISGSTSFLVSKNLPVNFHSVAYWICFYFSSSRWVRLSTEEGTIVWWLRGLTIFAAGKQPGSCLTRYPDQDVCFTMKFLRSSHVLHLILQ